MFDAAKAAASGPRTSDRPLAATWRHPIRRIIASYENLAIRLYSRVRFTILRQPFLEEIGQYLPDRGKILDVGSGFGLFSLYYAALEPERDILGIDLDGRRVQCGNASARKLGLTNVEYRQGDAMDLGVEQKFDAIYMMDLIHHLPQRGVADFLRTIRRLLNDNGILVIKDVAPTPWYKMFFTLILDRVMVGMEPIRYWPPEELAAILQSLGFSVVKHRMTDILPYPHILYVCRLN